MTERILPGIGLTGFWDQGAPWKVGGDQNLLRSSVLTQLAVESATTSLPASPLNGVIYIVPAADASANQVAARDNGAWVYFPPFEGLTAYVRDTGVLMNFDGAAWVPSTAPLSTALAATGGSTLVGYAQSGAGAVNQNAQDVLRRQKSTADYATLANVMAAKNGLLSSFEVLPGNLAAGASAISMTGYQYVAGSGDAAQVTFGAGGGFDVTSRTSTFDDHLHATFRDFRVTGDGVINPSYPNPQNGTTTGYKNTAQVNFARKDGMTFEGHAIGLSISISYTNYGCYNYYRGNKVGLKLDSVTSHSEFGSYFRYNSDAAVLITGSVQTVSFHGGAIEGNPGRAVYGNSLATGNSVTINLNDVYVEVCGKADSAVALGIPSIEIQDSANFVTMVHAGSYGFNTQNGQTSGRYEWGNRVVLNGAILAGYHYARDMVLSGYSSGSILVNTTAGLASDRLIGMREPAMLREFLVRNVGGAAGMVFSVAPTGRPTKKFLAPNLATQTYPFGIGVGGGPTIAADATLDYGDGSWAKVTYDVVEGNFNLNYASLQSFTDPTGAEPYRVTTLLCYPYGDIEIGFVSSIGGQNLTAFHKLKGGIKYRLMFLNTTAAAGSSILRAYPTQTNAPAVSFLSVYAAKFAQAEDMTKFARLVVLGEV